MTLGTPITLETLRQRHPEWATWLALYEMARDAAGDDVWTAAVPNAGSRAPLREAPAPHTARSLVAGATFAVDARAATRLVGALAGRAGATRPAAEAALDALDAAVALDDERLRVVGERTGIGGGLMVALAPLVALPLLHACARAWSARIPPAWQEAACPVCGAWAALAEARGVERTFQLRCGRCGADWSAEPVRCAFCGERDHEKLRGLVGQPSDTSRVDACTTCLAYMKTITTLTACAPEDVGLLDLATVELDVAAIDRGYGRPRRPAAPLGTRVVARGTRVFGAWLAGGA